MGKQLYVGNLNYAVTENDLQDMFAPHGTVKEVNLVMDRMSGRSRGFAFVTMETDEHAKAAMQALNGREFQGRALTVNEARPREEGGGGRSGGGGGGGGGRGYGSGGGGRGGGGGGGRGRGGGGGGGRY